MLNADLKQRLNLQQSMPILHSPEKERMRQQIANHVANYLAAGGKIQHVDSSANASRVTYDGLRIGIIINPERSARDIRPAIIPPVGGTGYRGVTKTRNGKHIARHKGRHLGTRDTAQEASALVQAAMAEEQQTQH